MEFDVAIHEVWRANAVRAGHKVIGNDVACRSPLRFYNPGALEDVVLHQAERRFVAHAQPVVMRPGPIEIGVREIAVLHQRV